MKKILTIVLALISLPAISVNSFYNHGSFPVAGSTATSAAMRAELDLIGAGFSLLPTLAGHAGEIAYINAAATAIATGSSAKLTSGGALTVASVNGNTITTGTGVLTLGAGKTTTFTSTSTFTGTDAANYTFPGATATIARTDAGQTFTGVQAMTSPAITTSITTPSTSFDAFNTTATTLNIGGAATTLNLGAATGTLTVANTTLAAKAGTFSTTLAVTGHTTFEGVTSTGATGTGKLVYDGSPVFTTPNIGSATGSVSGNAGTATSLAGGSGGTIPYQSAAATTAMLANGTAGQWLKANGTTVAPSWADQSTFVAGSASAVAVGGITGLGTGVATALAVNVGTAGSPVLNGGALGTSPDVTTSITTASTSFTAWAGATTLLTIGGTGASASLFAPSTLDATSSTTGAIRTSGGISAAKAANFGTTLTVAGTSSMAAVDATGALSVFVAGAGRTAGQITMSGTGSRDITFGQLSSTGGDQSIITFQDRSGVVQLQTNPTTDVTTIGSGNPTVTALAGTGSRAVLASATGVLSAPVSDASAKENMIPLTNQYDVMAMLSNESIRGISFDMLKDGDHQVGFTTQMFKDVKGLTGTMTASGTGYLNYDRIPAILWEQNRQLYSWQQRAETALAKAGITLQ